MVVCLMFRRLLKRSRRARRHWVGSLAQGVEPSPKGKHSTEEPELTSYQSRSAGSESRVTLSGFR